MNDSVQYWPAWAGAVGLAAMSISYYAITKRYLGLSKSFDRVLRGQRAEDSAARLLANQAELDAALLQATQEEFGLDISSLPAPNVEADPTAAHPAAPTPHLVSSRCDSGRTPARRRALSRNQRRRAATLRSRSCVCPAARWIGNLLGLAVPGRSPGWIRCPPGRRL